MTAMTLNVRISGPLSDHVARKIGDEGRYEDVSEYVRDLIRRELEHEETASFDALKAELQRAFATPDDEYHGWDAEAFLAEVKQQRA